MKKNKIQTKKSHAEPCTRLFICLSSGMLNGQHEHTYVECESLYNVHTHCLDNYTNFIVVETKAHESSAYAQGPQLMVWLTSKPLLFHSAISPPGPPHTFKACFCSLPATCDKFLASFSVNISKENKLLALCLWEVTKCYIEKSIRYEDAGSSFRQ